MTSPENDTVSETPLYVEHKVHHFQQRYNWDCGVSCVLMLLSPQQRDEVLANFTHLCEEEGFHQSTWTIDLCYLLKRFNIDHCMYTIRMGVNETYRKKKYYNKIIDQDLPRVLSRFSLSGARGVSVRARALPPGSLRAHLLRGPALLLVDSSLLLCDHCRLNRLYTELRRCFGGQFQGHYILVVGEDRRRRRLLYRDPARRDQLCVTRSDSEYEYHSEVAVEEEPPPPLPPPSQPKPQAQRQKKVKIAPATVPDSLKRNTLPAYKPSTSSRETNTESTPQSTSKKWKKTIDLFSIMCNEEQSSDGAVKVTSQAALEMGRGYSDLERAWTASGTDRDVILIFKNFR